MEGRVIQGLECQALSEQGFSQPWSPSLSSERVPDLQGEIGVALKPWIWFYKSCWKKLSMLDNSPFSPISSVKFGRGREGVGHVMHGTQLSK